MEAKHLKLLAAGGSNTDMVIRTGHLPRPGETVPGGTFFMNPGGKGANQAVAIARPGGQVVFICKTGNDIFGQQAQRLFGDEGIDTFRMLAGEAAAISVTRAGAQASVPYRREVDLCH
jgi:ribokinase